MRRGLFALSLAIPIGLSACTESPAVPLDPGGCGGFHDNKMRVLPVDKVDVLLVVDNSPAMADKQARLARDLPELLTTLTAPGRDPLTGRPSQVTDVHLAVISSSLGSHGTSACATPHGDDHGHLLTRAADCAVAAASPLSWTYDPAKGATFSGLPATQLQNAGACVVSSVKEDGCVFEETWESVYHFLVDPAPYAKAEVKCAVGPDGDVCGNNKIVVDGLDTELLAQRRAFLRSDSLLMIIVLSDENDASLKPAGLNWLPWGYPAGKMQPGWAACAAVPDDFEPETNDDFKQLHDGYKCFSCFEDASDPACKTGWLAPDVDAPNLRAFQQVQRFGYNFLWGRKRYVDAFTQPTALGSDKIYAANGVFAGGFRDKSMVVVTAIVGVPGKLVANDDGTPRPLSDEDWERIVGPVDKRDPHMIESIVPRKGVPLFAGDRAIDATNGGDRALADGDLQYACIAPRAEKGVGPDCSASTTGNPLCAPDGSQPYFKAYPGLRHLRILKELGASVVGSICSDSFGPTLRSTAEEAKVRLSSQCAYSPMKARSDGSVSCMIFEVLRSDAGISHCEDVHGLCTAGASPCRSKAVSRVDAAAELNLPLTVVRSDGTTSSSYTQASVDGDDVVLIASDGSRHLVCEVQQLSGDSLQACAKAPGYSLDPSKAGGFCFTSEQAMIGDRCKKFGSTGTLRFLGGAAPRAGSETFTFCREPC